MVNPSLRVTTPSFILLPAPVSAMIGTATPRFTLMNGGIPDSKRLAFHPRQMNGAPSDGNGTTGRTTILGAQETVTGVGETPATDSSQDVRL